MSAPRPRCVPTEITSEIDEPHPRLAVKWYTSITALPTFAAAARNPDIGGITSNLASVTEAARLVSLGCSSCGAECLVRLRIWRIIAHRMRFSVRNGRHWYVLPDSERASLAVVSVVEAAEFRHLPSAY